MATFPFTPGYIHGEQYEYRVNVVQFVDGSEQRFASSAQRGTRLVYEWPTIDSCALVEIASWFQAYGMQDSFGVLDHRDRTLYSARHVAPQLMVERGPIDKRRFRVEFLTVGAGATIPTGVAYVPGTHDCSLYGNSITPPASGEPPIIVTSTSPPTSTHPYSGGIPVDSGTDGGPWLYVQTSVWHVTGLWTGDPLSVADRIRTNYRAMPFIIARSGAVLGRFGLFNKDSNGGHVYMGVYCQRTPTSILPGGLIYAAPELPMAVGEVVASCHIVLSSGLYYVVAVSSSVSLTAMHNSNNHVSLGYELDGLASIRGFESPATTGGTHSPLASQYPAESLAAYTGIPWNFLYMIVG